MRWRFLDSANRLDVAERGTVTAKIDAWWDGFQRKADDLCALFSRKAEWDLPEWMATHLQAIHPELMWEFGRAIDGNGHRLVITPESAHHLRPLTATIVGRAPRIAGWEFYAYRLPEDLEMTLSTVEVRAHSDISDFKVRVGRGDHHRVDLCFYSPSISGKGDQRALHAAFVAVETLLGEECLDKWVGAFEVCPLESRKGLRSLFRRGAVEPPRLIGLDRLRETVVAVVESIREQMPQRPHFEWSEDSEWTLWKLTPTTADDYPEQLDLFVGKSANPSMWTAAHNDRLFYSERFSRCEETFCYLKLDGSQGLDEEKFADKAEIEDALDEVLKPNKLGCQIGGGTGRRYSYIDLALVDVDRGIEAMRQRLQAGNVPKRSWIQFFDADLTAEWVGVYDDSPPPPMPDFDK